MASLRFAALALLLAIPAVPGCAFRRGDPLPAEPPIDFSVEVRVKEAPSWPWDGLVSFGSTGSVAWDITFKSPPSNRRGSEPMPEGMRQEAWTAVIAAGLFDREPIPKGLVRGPVVVEGRAMGIDGRWCGDPAEDSDLAGLLETLRRAVPPRAFRPLPADGPPR